VLLSGAVVACGVGLTTVDLIVNEKSSNRNMYTVVTNVVTTTETSVHN